MSRKKNLTGITIVTVAPVKKVTVHRRLTIAEVSSPHTTLSQSAIWATAALFLMDLSALKAAEAMVAGGITLGGILAVLYMFISMRFCTSLLNRAVITEQQCSTKASLLSLH